MIIKQISFSAEISVCISDYEQKKSDLYASLQFDYSGYLWAVCHLVCVGKCLNTERCYTVKSHSCISSL